MGAQGSWAEAATAQLPEGQQRPREQLHPFPCTCTRRGEVLGLGMAVGNPHPGKDAQMNSVVFALHAQAHSWLHAHEPWTHHFTFPKIPPSPLWKGQRSQVQLRHRKVRCVLMGCGREDGKPPACSETGTKAGNHLLNLVSSRCHLPSLVVGLRPGPHGEGFHGKGLACSKAILSQSPSPRAPVACPHRGDIPAVWGQAEAQRPVPCGTGMEEPAELPWRFSP